ncbi:MAG: DUF4416 family protein [Candidatus Omnitrophica bacterium]|nr:DUF4416 family protein [Candidatus Omnitrophota bacterium]MDD5437299.1 DUF4416 family protein [Candidatus Omnitrophota bacterium]
MGIPRRPERVKLIVGLLFRDQEKYSAVKDALVRMFGKIDYESDALDFTQTSYYAGEMGGSLKRRFLSFERLHDLKTMHNVKVGTNRMEGRYLDGRNRTVNIDPGYLNLSKVVLFSTKDYTHRIYLNKGIFCEVTLFYKDGKFNPWPWTYPDYKTEEYLRIFNDIRELYRAQKA